MIDQSMKSNWRNIRKIFKRGFFSSFHYAVASVNPDGTPHVSPIGSLILHENEPKGFYFEIFTTHLKKNVETNPNICVLATNSGVYFWLRSLLIGRFSSMPAVRLRGTAGIRRLATEEEIRRWKTRIWFLKILPGYNLLWGNLVHVREIQFNDFESVRMGKMTSTKSGISELS